MIYRTPAQWNRNKPPEWYVVEVFNDAGQWEGVLRVRAHAPRYQKTRRFLWFTWKTGVEPKPDQASIKYARLTARQFCKVAQNRLVLDGIRIVEVKITGYRTVIWEDGNWL